MKQPLAIALIALVSACATSGTPMLRSDANDGQGPIIEGCRNVSAAARMERFNTANYLTTLGSAWMEGATQGFSEGLSPDGPVSHAVRQAVVRPTTTENAVFNELPRSFTPYCRVYDGERRSVARIVAELLPQLGYPMLVSEERVGVFQTGPVNRGSANVTAFTPAWRDSYVVTVEETAPRRVIVRVLRSIHIARDPGIYNQGISSGQNELYIFTHIHDRLARWDQEQQLAAQAAEAERQAAEAQRESRRGELTARYGDRVANAIISGQVNVGMTPQQVIEARGQPSRRERLTPSDEIWHYGASERIGFSGGRVTFVRR